jgi:repressor LexA
MTKLTRRQKDVLRFVKSFLNKNGYPPSRHDICKAMGFCSVNSAQEHLHRLAKKGYITLTKGVGRGIRINKPKGNGK